MLGALKTAGLVTGLARCPLKTGTGGTNWYSVQGEKIESSHLSVQTSCNGRACEGFVLTRSDRLPPLLPAQLALYSDKCAPGAERTPVQFLAYDLLWMEGHSTVELVRYAERRELLDGLSLTGPNWQTPPYFPGGGEFALEAARAQGLTGVVAKRLDSPYLPGRRSRLWLSVRA